MPRFVVLTHDHPTLHWDLLLEAGEVLRSWRLAFPPETPGEIGATAIPDHRLRYLDYEGEISGGRGSVTRWDAGEYTGGQLPDETWDIRLAGKRLQGTARLERDEQETAGYRFRFTPDPPSCD